MWQQNRQTAWIAIATTAAVVFIGVLSWILLGAAFSIAILLAELARPHDALLVRKPGSDELHDLGDDDQDEGIPGLVVYRFYGPLIFANVSFFMERLQGFIDQQKHPVDTVIIDATAITSVDFSALEKLRPYFQKLREQGIELAIARVHLPLRGMELVREWTPFFLMTGFLYGFLMQCVLSAGTRRRVTRRHMRSNYDNRQAYTAIMVGQFQAR